MLGRRGGAAAIRHMAEQEQAHLETFDRLLVERGVRPTLLSPMWSVAGYALGAGTALMGEKAAMACTVAVEEVIDEHYARQAGALGEDEKDLRQVIDQGAPRRARSPRRRARARRPRSAGLRGDERRHQGGLAGSPSGSRNGYEGIGAPVPSPPSAPENVSRHSGSVIGHWALAATRKGPKGGIGGRAAPLGSGCARATRGRSR